MNNEKKITTCVINKVEGVKDERPYKFYTLFVIIDGLECQVFLKDDVAKKLVDKDFNNMVDYNV